MQWQEPPEGSLELVEQFDPYAAVRNELRRLAHKRAEWAGYPLPLDGHHLIVEPTYPKAAEIMGINRPEPTAEDEADAKRHIRNRFWSWKYRCDVVVWEEDGAIQWGPLDPFNQTYRLLQTVGVSSAWGIEQEGTAVRTLGGMLRHASFKSYLLTGMFLEKSKRSGVTYLFRKLRPTLALSTRGERPRVLAALCLHPIAYYADTWSGAMCPTDDVIAHLALMRGDEHMFWKRANQHAPHRKEAGLI